MNALQMVKGGIHSVTVLERSKVGSGELSGKRIIACLDIVLTSRSSFLVGGTGWMCLEP